MSDDTVNLSLVDHGDDMAVTTSIRGQNPRIEIEMSQSDDGDACTIAVEISGGVLADELADFLRDVADMVDEALSSGMWSQ